MNEVSQDVTRQLSRYRAALSRLSEWIEHAQVLALLSAAVQIGLLDALDAPRTAHDLADRLRLPGAQVAPLCEALAAYGVLTVADGRYSLSPNAAVLLDPASPQTLGPILAGAEATVQMLRQAAGAQASATGEQAGLDVAGSIGTSSLSAARAVIPQVMAQTMPEVGAVWAQGGRHLEVGCGVGNNLLGVVSTFTGVHGVGLDLNPLVVAEAEGRAKRLGLEHRVTLRVQDARDLNEQAAYDTAQWSQYFFTAQGREQVLARLGQALRPGGLVFLPLLGSPDDGADQREVQRSSLSRALFAALGVPVETAEVRAEVERAGFEVLRVMAVPPGPLSNTRGLLLARRPELRR